MKRVKLNEAGVSTIEKAPLWYEYHMFPDKQFEGGCGLKNQI